MTALCEESHSLSFTKIRIGIVFVQISSFFIQKSIHMRRLLEMFKYNEFKVRILNQKVKTETTQVYRCGPLIDLCRGPHVRHTGKIKGWLISEGIFISVNL